MSKNGRPRKASVILSPANGGAKDLLLPWLCLPLWLMACTAPAPVPLASLAAQAPEAAKTPSAPSAAAPLLLVSSSDVPALAARVQALLPLLLEPAEAASANAAIRSVALPARASVRVDSVTVDVLKGSDAPTITALDAVLVALPPATPEGLEPLLNRALALVGPGLAAKCSAGPDGRVVCATAKCAVGPDGRVGCLTDGEVPIPALDLPDESALLDVRLSVPAVAGLLERTLGIVTTWAVLPEELLRFQSLGIAVSARDEITGRTDRVEVFLEARDSKAFDALGGLFAVPEREAKLPKSTSALAYTSVHEVPTVAERLDAVWGKKLAGSAVGKLLSQVNDKWTTQLLELVSGELGVAIAGKIQADNPWAGLVWIFQPTDADMLEKRLEFIFSAKSFKMESRDLRTGEHVRSAVRRQKGKAGQEWLAWFSKDGTYYIAKNSNVLFLLAEAMYVREGSGKELLSLTLPGDEKVAVAISPPKLLDSLILPEDAGLAGGMALAMVKTAVAGMPGELKLTVLFEDHGEGEQRLVVRVENLLDLVDRILKQLGPLLNVAGG